MARIRIPKLPERLAVGLMLARPVHRGEKSQAVAASSAGAGVGILRGGAPGRRGLYPESLGLAKADHRCLTRCAGGPGDCWRKPIAGTAIGRNCSMFDALRRWAGKPEKGVTMCWRLPCRSMRKSGGFTAKLWINQKWLQSLGVSIESAGSG